MEHSWRDSSSVGRASKTQPGKPSSNHNQGPKTSRNEAQQNKPIATCPQCLLGSDFDFSPSTILKGPRQLRCPNVTLCLVVIYHVFDEGTTVTESLPAMSALFFDVSSHTGVRHTRRNQDWKNLFQTNPLAKALNHAHFVAIEPWCPPSCFWGSCSNDGASAASASFFCFNVG